MPRRPMPFFSAPADCDRPPGTALPCCRSRVGGGRLADPVIVRGGWAAVVAMVPRAGAIKAVRGAAGRESTPEVFRQRAAECPAVTDARVADEGSAQAAYRCLYRCHCPPPPHLHVGQQLVSGCCHSSTPLRRWSCGSRHTPAGPTATPSTHVTVFEPQYLPIHQSAPPPHSPLSSPASSPHRCGQRRGRSNR